MKTLEQIYRSIDRFQRSFWNREAGLRPPVGVSIDGANTPIMFLKKKVAGAELHPEDITGDFWYTDYDFIACDRRVFSDDLMPFSAAWRAVPWLEAMCGCPVRCAHGSLAPGRCVESADALRQWEIPAHNGWRERLNTITGELVRSLPDDCFISPTILRGPSDIIAAMRGMEHFYLDLYDDIGAVREAAARVNRLFFAVLERHFAAVPPHHGGYVHVYGYWAPGRTNVIQEDALGMCSPSVYRDVFMELNADIVKRFGSCFFFHFHSTGFQFWRDVMAIPGLAGIELTIEENGPRLIGLAPVLREILERTRLILFVYHYFEDVREILKSIPHDGLYLIISDKFITSDDEYRAFIASVWDIFL